MDNQEKEQVQISFEIIMHAGDARSYCLESLANAKNGEFETSEKLFKLAREEYTKAHQIQTAMLTNFANGAKMTPNLILVHAQDHISGASVCIDLCEDLIDLTKQVSEIKEFIRFKK